MKRTVLVYASLIFALLLLFQVSKYSLFTGNLKIEIVISVVAIVFFLIGIYLNKKSLHKIHLPPKKVDQKKIESLQISKREYEVLNNMALGLSNKEIGEKLFISESTIKTHVSNLLAKLNAKRRTQAIQIAKELRVI